MSTRPPTVELERRGETAVVTINRAHKRNALDNATVVGLGELFVELAGWAKVAVLTAVGEHFSAGLDLNELDARDAVSGLNHSRMWHEAFQRIESGIPVVAVLKGAVVGGGLELAVAAHLRVVEDSAFFALPEGQRGLFVGGGASVRVPRLTGVQKMRDMMLTGRVLSADEGAAAGLADYRVGHGEGLGKALQLAERIAENSPLSNHAVLRALPLIAESPPATGLMMESLMAAVAQSSDEAKTRMRDFVEGRSSKVTSARTESD